MEIRIRNVITEYEADLLHRLDTSFSTGSVYQVTAGVDGFALRETPVAPPLRKRYDLVEGVTVGSRPWDLYALAMAGPRPVGFMATTYERWNGRQVVNELHVAPAYRRRGVARELLSIARVTAGENGAREIWLETQNVNVAAVRAYRRLGFTLTGIDTTRYLPPYTDEVALFMSAPVSADGSSAGGPAADGPTDRRPVDEPIDESADT
ncbi:GNAT family N-acetyltransferase [Solwaraspora sp. WMMD406]|uniref:GNAT family N-acetyltransferase n=1 Tax=Solwaraspora sp. WMMD406 TaxID=3016095 RepID=UPI0024180743|nr:GNAT family N-acetyltransferase [Solwaraspora sp. WMMD406]MDG4763070.1 GNAT family N-acetyltransferase [Solwaraspora sp. WMMD406]